MQLANRLHLAGPQRTGVERLNCGLGVGERGRGGARGRSKGEDLEALDARDGDDMVVTVLGLFDVAGVGRRRGVDGYKVGDRIDCEQCTFVGYHIGLGSGEAHT